MFFTEIYEGKGWRESFYIFMILFVALGLKVLAFFGFLYVIFTNPLLESNSLIAGLLERTGHSGPGALSLLVVGFLIYLHEHSYLDYKQSSKGTDLGFIWHSSNFSIILLLVLSFYLLAPQMIDAASNMDELFETQ